MAERQGRLKLTFVSPNGERFSYVLPVDDFDGCRLANIASSMHVTTLVFSSPSGWRTRKGGTGVVDRQESVAQYVPEFGSAW